MTDMIELAKRAVACKHWRWTSGMRGTSNIYTDRFRDRFVVVQGGSEDDVCTVVNQRGEGAWVEYSFTPDSVFTEGYGALPDLTDPATRGCLLQLVREAFSDPFALVACGETGDGVRMWGLCFDSFDMNAAAHEWAWPPTEAEALVDALEQAP